MLHIWDALQVFLETFPEFRSHRFNLYGISYGAAFASLLADHILTQNYKIQRGVLRAHPIHLDSLVAVSGWFDLSIQAQAKLYFARHNAYGPLISDATFTHFSKHLFAELLPRLELCPAVAGSTAECVNAMAEAIRLNGFLQSETGASLADAYDLRSLLERKRKGIIGKPADATDPPFPPHPALNSTSVRHALGAESPFQGDKIGVSWDTLDRFLNFGERECDRRQPPRLAPAPWPPFGSPTLTYLQLPDRS